MFISDFSRDLGLRIGARSEAALVNPPGISFPPEDLCVPKEDIVLFSGKFDVRKGILDIFEVARRLPEVRFRLICWGSDEPQYRQKAPSNVEFVPFERGRPLQEGFARARIFLFPSYAETFGLVLAEAMAAGCAIVSTIPLGYRGIRVQPGDCDAMTEAVMQLWNDRALTEEMGRENKEIAKQFTWERHADRILRMADEILSGVTA
jgi:glycosyltransferase involved in cell wall biosynthesis